MLDANAHVREYVDDFVHDLLAPEDRKAVAQHCTRCPDCQSALKEAEQRLATLERVPITKASESLIRGSVSQAIRPYSEQRAFAGRVFWIGVAAAAVLLAIVHVYFHNLSPSPYDLAVLGQTELIADAEASLRVRLANRKDGSGVEGVRVEIMLLGAESKRSLSLASFTTDRFGTGRPSVRLPDWPDGDYQLQVAADVRGRDEVITRKVALKRSWKLMLSTDKPTYQPSQTIHMRSLALRRPDLKPVAGHEVVFSVSDPKGNVVFRRQGVTSRFGIASADCPLATEIIEGAYSIKCTLGDTTSKATVDVKKYVLPKFKIELTLDRSYYQPGNVVRGELAARYFFGKPVGGGDVTIQVETTDVEVRTIEQLGMTLDERGLGQFTFRVPTSLVGREQDGGDAELRLTAVVRDSAGQQQSRSVRTLVTAHPLRIEVIPEAGKLVRGVANTVYLFARYADGRPARARLAITGRNQELATNDFGVAALELTPTDPSVTWVISATDQDGITGWRRVTLDVGHVTDDFLVRTDKAVYNGGDTMRLMALGGGDEPVFVDLIKDGQTILSQTIEMATGRGELQIDLPPELAGTVELCTYRLSKTGLPSRKTRAIYVHQAAELSVRAELDRPEYRPGERATLRMTLTDANGKPTPGAIGLSAVDEAVYSVRADRPGLEQSFFLLEQEILKPVYALYPWSPGQAVAEPQRGRTLLEQALFARTGIPAGDRDASMRELVDKYLEGDERILDVLQRPDWEQLIDPSWFPPGALALLKGERSPHSLSATSYPSKRQRTEGTKKMAARLAKGAWMVLGFVAFVGFCLTALGPRAVDVLVALTILGILVALLLPAVQSAREAARRSEAANDVRQLALGLQNMQDAKGESAFRVDGTTDAPAPRVREWFPETLLWRPELVTDDNGQLAIDVDLADSITTWRVSASAVSADGRLGGGGTAIRVFQPFFVDLNLPVALTRGDEVAVPVVVYNYVDRPLTVELRLREASWFELLEKPEATLKLGAGEVRSTYVRLRAMRVGNHELEVTARGDDVGDAIRRQIEVVPDGRLVEQVTNGVLREPVDFPLQVPEDAIEGSSKAIVKIYPSSFSQVVEGLDSIFQRPYGCFEQTSSTTYPNVLALDYLRRTKRNVPEVEAKARQYIHLGYQRLLSFEVAGGGFDWFGNPPANRTLTAYGLMEFEDMARVHDVDPQLIARTREWLLTQRRPDGSWPNEAGMLNDGLAGSVNRSGSRDLAATAYVAWAIFGNTKDRAQSDPTLGFLRSHRPKTIGSAYVLALVSNALLAIAPSGREAKPYLDRLVSLRTSSDDESLTWWSQRDAEQTMFYGAGRSGDIETTATATLALLAAGREPAVTRGALAWLIESKDAMGAWHSTQATVLALKALLAGTGKPLGGDVERRIELELDGKVIQTFVIPADESDVMRQFVLSDLAPGRHRIVLTDLSGTAPGYQIAFRHHVPDHQDETVGPLSIDIQYNRTELATGEEVTATATVVNRSPSTAPMVIVDLPIPAGFAVETDDLDAMVASGEIAKYQLTPRSAILYLRGLRPSQSLELRYRLRATMPVKVRTPPGVTYLYYDPDTRDESLPVSMTVVPDTSA